MAGLKSGQKIRASNLNMSVSRYVATDNTATIATGGTERTLAYSSAVTTHSNVTASGTNNTTFTLNKTGTWLIGFEHRWTFGTAPTTGDTFFYAYLVSGVVILSGTTNPSPVSNAPKQGGMFIRPFTSGDQIQTRLRNSTNQILTLANNSTCAITLAFLQG